VSAADVPCDVRRSLCFGVMFLAWTPDGRAAEQPPAAIRFDLRIAAQPLDEALQEFARQSEIQVVYFSGITAGLQSPGVNGKYTVGEALNALLAGSGLSFRMINARTVAIRKAEAATPHQSE
jgi:Secretin and TonB N terminus short domain